MISSDDFIHQRWTYLARTLLSSFKSIGEQFYKKFKQIQKQSSQATTAEMKFINSEHIRFFEVWLDNIALAETEAELILNFAKYLMIIDTEIAKKKLQNRFIYMENRWLKNEMYDLQGSLMKIEHDFMEAESEKKHFQYYFNMRNFAKADQKTNIVVERVNQQEDVDSDPDEDVPPNMSALFNVVMQFIAESRHTVAISWCQKSIGDYQKQKGEMSSEVGSIHNLLGRVYKSFGYPIIAQECFEKSLEIREKVHGKDSDPVGITLTLLGSIMGKREMYKDAIACCKRALTIREPILTKTHLEISRLHVKLAEFSLKLKHWNDSINYYNTCLGNLENIYDSTEMIVIRCYTNLARAYIESSNLKKGSEFLEKANLSYTTKNNRGLIMSTTPFALIEDCLKRSITEFQAEMLMQKFGSIAEILDENVVDVMILYYEKLNETKITELLKSWRDLSNKIVSNVEIGVGKLHRRMSTLQQQYDSGESQSMSMRQSMSVRPSMSIRPSMNVRQSIHKMFKTKK